MIKHGREGFWNFVWIGLAAVGFILTGWQGAAAQDQRIDVNELVQETERASTVAGELNLVWWLPEEFWKASVAANPNVTPEQLELILKAVRPYFIVGVANGKMASMGTVTYRTEDEIRGIVQLKDDGGNLYKPLPEDKVDASVPALLGLMKPFMAKTVGALGENIHFYVFAGSKTDGARICDPLKEGACEVDVGERAFKWRLPIGSLLPKQKCPVCGEILSGAYRFCPYDGTKLPGSK